MIIDDLYRKYSDKEIPARLAWDKVRPGLKRKLFLRFVPTKFNIYYLLLIVSLSGYASYATFRNYLMRKETHPTPQKVIQYKATIDTLKQTSKIVIPGTARKKNDSKKISVQQKKVEVNKSDSVKLKKDTTRIERMQFKCIRRTVKLSEIEQSDTVKRK